MTLGQGHDTPFGHGQQLCEILSRSDKGDTKLWPGHENRRTDSVIPIYHPKLCKGGGGYNNINFQFGTLCLPTTVCVLILAELVLRPVL